MTAKPIQVEDRLVIERQHLEQLFEALKRCGYQVVGPTVREGAILYDRLNSVADLPAGWTDEQGGGKYRLTRRKDGALFRYAVGPHSWKKFLHPPVHRLWRAKRNGTGVQIQAENHETPKYAFILKTAV